MGAVTWGFAGEAINPNTIVRARVNAVPAGPTAWGLIRFTTSVNVPAVVSRSNWKTLVGQGSLPAYSIAQ
eukprot:COSAG05_NODE_16457_length_345_cov_1.654472_1_plen_69_part_10